MSPTSTSMQLGFKCLPFMSIFRNRAQEGARPHTLQFSPTHLTKCKLGFNVCLSWTSLEIKSNWMFGLSISPPAEDHHQCTQKYSTRMNMFTFKVLENPFSHPLFHLNASCGAPQLSLKLQPLNSCRINKCPRAS